MSASKLISAPNDIGPTQGRLWPVSEADYLPRHFWRRLIMGGFQALALFALLVVVIAPLFDHHYAQRDPHHAHIYLGVLDAASLTDHHHAPPTQAHDHDSAGAPFLNATGVFSVPAAGDWSPQGLRAPLLLLLALPLALFAAATGHFERLQPCTVIPCSQPFLPPPEKPPRP